MRRTEIQIGGVYKGTKNAADDNGTNRERVILVGDLGIHEEGLVKILLFLGLSRGGGLELLDLGLILLGRGVSLGKGVDIAQRGRIGEGSLLLVSHGARDKTAKCGERKEETGKNGNPGQRNAAGDGVFNQLP